MIKVLQNYHTNTLVKENIIQLIHHVCKLALKYQKIVRKVGKSTSKVEPPTKMLLKNS